jgi:antitoxin component of MazEF toxin-antitoxin module
MTVPKRFLFGLVTIGALGCSSTRPDVQDIVGKARAVVGRQEADAETLVHALASAQRAVANASWDPIVNAAAQNLRMAKGAALDSPLSADDHALVEETARKNLATLLDQISETEARLLQAMKTDYAMRADLLENLARNAKDSATLDGALKALEALDLHRIEFDQVDNFFKTAVMKQTGYVG